MVDENHITLDGEEYVNNETYQEDDEYDYYYEETRSPCWLYNKRGREPLWIALLTK